MAIFQGDAYFRRVIDLILIDIKKNPWLIDDALSDFIQDPVLSTIYGQAEIENAKKWFRDNEISVFLSHRMDLEKMPCITISIGGEPEDKSLARMADQTNTIETYEASHIGKTIPYIIPPFDIVSYDQLTGFVEVPGSVNLILIQPGMVAVDPDTGGGFVVTSKTSNGFFVAPNSPIGTLKIGILPQYRIFRARREMATFQQRITIGCHSHGDPSTLLWLHTIIFYGLLRYREGLLESRNFQLSNLDNSEMIRNPNFESIGENVYSRFITLSGQVENTWVKAPKRIVEAINLNDFEKNESQPGANDGVGPGIIIINKDGGQVPEIIDEDCEIWVGEDIED